MKAKRKTEEQDLQEQREYHSPSCGIFFKTKKQLYSENSAFQKIEIIENETYGRILFLDGLVQTTEKDEFFYHEMIVHPACLTHASPERVLIIGGGDGGTLREVLRHPQVKEVDLVEIDAQVIDVCRKYFPWLTENLKDKRANLVVADGARFIEESGKSYDVVLIDSSEPVGPSTPLHERGFYERLKKRLQPGGVITAQTGSPLYHLEAIREKYLYLRELFKRVHFYLCPVPTYPGGSWCFVFLSDDVDPLMEKRMPPSGLKHFNREVHRAAFALPNYMRQRIEGE